MGQHWQGVSRQHFWSSARLATCVMMTAAVVATVGGCNHTPKAGRFTIVVNPTGASQDQAYDVDMFGVASAGEYESWGSNEVGGHFAGGQSSQTRQDRKPMTLHWEVGDSGSKQLAANDPKWNDWMDRGAWYLVIATNREFVGAGGGRQYDKPIVLPLDTRRWKNKKLIEIEILNSGMNLVTRMEPPPQP